LKNGRRSIVRYGGVYSAYRQAIRGKERLCSVG
jgi:hypothetical protein